MTAPKSPPPLIGGPYSRPKGVEVGDVVRCEVLGDLRVTGFTDAPIPWPVGLKLTARGGSPSLVVRDDLARAVETESALAVRHHFGVSASVVRRWRRALGVGRSTKGTVALQASRETPRLSPEDARKYGRKGARKRWGGDTKPDT